MTELDRKNHSHYSEQNGHALRSEHERVRKMLDGEMPEGINGFNGIEQQRIRRTMRRVPRTGKR